MNRVNYSPPCLFTFSMAFKQPRSQGLLRFQDGGREKTHTVIPPAKYSTNRGVFCHVTHNRISFSLHLISGSRNQKWRTMSEDVASMWLHFACFSSKIVFFCGPLNFQIHLSRFLIPGSVWLEYFVICKVRVDENFTLLLYLLLYTYLTLFRFFPRAWGQVKSL